MFVKNCWYCAGWDYELSQGHKDTCEYYFSWGASKATDAPGLSDMLYEAVNDAFREDRVVLEAQHRNLKERPDGNLVNIVHDAGPEKMLRLLDRLLAEEAAEGAALSAPRARLRA